jgi:glyoxylase-like metal-dependent hydrolase (beta-lactamase superfamily II)
MKSVKNYFNIKKIKEYIYVIQEDITAIHPVYKNSPLNLYLIKGKDKALLVDTGCGIKSPKPLLQELIEKRELIVVNSHTHWDHILGNHYFKTVYVHKNGEYIVSNPYNVSFLRGSPSKLIKTYEKENFLISPAENIKTIKEGHIFQLGEINLKVLHTPGHSSESICLLTNKNECFIGDVAYYGEQFLPQRNNFQKVLSTLSQLISLYEEKGSLDLYPSHNGFPCDKSLLTKLYNGIENIENIWDQKKENQFFRTYELDDGNFKYYIQK